MSRRKLKKKLQNAETDQQRNKIQKRLDFTQSKGRRGDKIPRAAKPSSPSSAAEPFGMPRGGMKKPITPDNAFGPRPELQDGADRSWAPTLESFADRYNLEDLAEKYAAADSRPKHLQGRGTMADDMRAGMRPKSPDAGGHPTSGPGEDDKPESLAGFLEKYRDHPAFVNYGRGQ